jgi:Family of unknown function (DUF6166)
LKKVGRIDEGTDNKRGSESLKVYTGHGTGFVVGGKKVTVSVDGGPSTELSRVGNSSHPGFNWGYLGTGPRDLSLSLLSDHFGEARAWLLRDAFLADFVAGWDQGRSWSITSSEIDDWAARLPPPRIGERV